MTLDTLPLPSIHWRRRWWYALWAAGLLGALGFWAFWETPAVSGIGHVVVSVKVIDLPQGSKVEAWAGPILAWKADGKFLGPWAVVDTAKALPIPPIEIKAGLRRWRKDYIPRLTSDYIVIRLDPPQGKPRYLAYDLASDLRSGVAGPHRRLWVSAPVRWTELSEDASRPSPLLI